MNYQEQVELNKKVLDKIDMKPYLKRGMDLRDIMGVLEDKYEETLTSDVPELHGDLFYHLDPFDFKLYVEQRYNINVHYWEEEHFEIVSV